MGKRTREKSDVHAQTTTDLDSENHALREENRALHEIHDLLTQQKSELEAEIARRSSVMGVKLGDLLQETAMLVRSMESLNAKAEDTNRQLTEMTNKVDDEIKECRSVLRRPKSPLVSVGAFGRMRATPKSVDKMQKNSLERK